MRSSTRIPPNVATNEMAGTFPVTARGVHGRSFQRDSPGQFHGQIHRAAPGQAEGLLLVGGQNIVSHVTVEGSGDALQVNDSVYLTDSRIVGDGDNILGRGPAFFNHCELISRYGPHMWIRNTSANHGNVFVNCTLRDARRQRDGHRPRAHQPRQGLPLLRSGADQLRPCGHQPRGMGSGGRRHGPCSLLGVQQHQPQRRHSRWM